MAMIGAASVAPRKTAILPEGGRDFLRRRMMEIVGLALAAGGVALLMSVFTFSNADPSLNHATGNPPANLLGLPGAYVSDLLLQTFGLAIVLVGQDPASEVYVRNKVRTGQGVGFRVDLERLPETATLEDVLALVRRLNNVGKKHRKVICRVKIGRAHV